MMCQRCVLNEVKMKEKKIKNNKNIYLNRITLKEHQQQEIPGVPKTKNIILLLYYR